MPFAERTTGWVVAVALALAGWFIGQGFAKGRTRDRYVTVKGVSEREVKADLALWPLQLASTDDDLSRAQTRLNGNVEKVTAFLIANGIDSSQVSLQGLRVTDVLANPYQQQVRAGNRFIINQTVVVRSNDPDRVLAASAKAGELVNAGVVLSSGPEWGPGGPTFLFKRLNDLKPEMIAEATAEARKGAEQFAHDSGSRVGRIRTATQGIFVILPRDEIPGSPEQNQLYKTVRVVTTVEYLLED